MVQSDEAKEELDEGIHRLIDAVPHTDKLLVVDNLNARIGADHMAWDKVIGRHAGGKENSSGRPTALHSSEGSALRNS